MTNENRKYKIAFFVALAVIVALAVVVARNSRATRQPADGTSVAIANTPSPASPTPEPTAPIETRLAPVQLSPERMQAIGVKIGRAEEQNVTDEIRAAGNVEMDERRLAYVQTRFPGWIRKVYADATYQFVRKGEPLFTIYSPDLVSTEQEYLLAKKNAESVRSSSISGVSAGSENLLTAARQRLEQWEMSPEEIAKLETTGKVITDLTFNSPVAGYITERNALPNMYVQPETRLYTVADLSSVWVYAQIFQTDLGKIKPGDAAVVTVDAYPGASFRGRVSEILPQVDVNTRTARVRLIFENPGLKLKPGMFVNVGLRNAMGRQLVVPSSAVLHAGTRQVVFLSREQGLFEPREVETSGQVGDKIVISKGLKPGEPILTSANFLIDSESQLQAAAGAFAPPPPGAGAAAAMNHEGAPKAEIEITTDPTPPHRGSNKLRVKLTGARDAAVTGAQVNVTFYMPAMPSMGMAAMKTSVDLTEKPSGLYEGTGQLDSGGTWQITITATLHGEVIATRRMNMTAKGGM
ncbi:MAG TPA: efflux RND transporter periplasmic adaptor subunit [Candidatus Angelobacter sp.]|nr:efflux RND transporter periplasmic adaptor subunit [Candidatus Angelobacter sp.]